MDDLEKWEIKRFRIVADYTIEIVFNDDKIQIINFEPVIGRGWLEKLKDKEYFKKVKLGFNRNLEWPDGQDFNPEALYNWETFEKHYREENF